jgi:hypothetical protein
MDRLAKAVKHCVPIIFICQLQAIFPPFSLKLTRIIWFVFYWNINHFGHYQHLNYFYNFYLLHKFCYFNNLNIFNHLTILIIMNLILGWCKIKWLNCGFYLQEKNKFIKILGGSLPIFWQNIFVVKVCCHTLGIVCKFMIKD